MGGETVLMFPPHIDLANVDEIKREVNDAIADGERGPDLLVLDLADVTFVDSLGLGLLIHARNRCDALDVPLVLRNSPPMAKRLMAMSALDTLFTFDPV